MNLFRRGRDRAEAEKAVEVARTILEILRLSGANLRAALDLVDQAEGYASRRSFEEAVDFAAKAERVAMVIESDYRGATAARSRLRSSFERMLELGMPSEQERQALGEVRARPKSTRDVEGVAVPDYAGAMVVASEAAARAEARIALRENAGDVLFAAELAIEGLLDVGGRFLEGMAEARELLAKAHGEVENGQYELAATDAAVAEKIALGLMERRREAREMVESLEKLVTGLRGAGILVTEVREPLDLGKALLGQGKVNAAIEVLNGASEEARSLGTRYRELLDAMTAAEAAIEELNEEGLSSSEAEISIDRARSALKVGNYALAAACCEDVHLAVSKRRAFRQSLRALLDETKAQLHSLKDSGAEFVNDAEEMVLRAENEFANGEYDASNEDLRIASILLAPVLNERAKEGLTPP